MIIDSESECSDSPTALPSYERRAVSRLRDTFMFTPPSTDLYFTFGELTVHQHQLIG